MAASTKIDVAKHILVPKHTKLSEEEAKKVLEKFNVGKRQLPMIRPLDPALRGMDAKPGDVIKIERESPTAGKSEFYRVVINV